MRRSKRRFYIVLAGFLLLLTACNTKQTKTPEVVEQPSPSLAAPAAPMESSSPTPSPAPQESEAPKSGIPEGGYAASVLYMDPEMKMMIMLKSPDWTYEKDHESGQVYFFNENEGMVSGNVISMSAISYQGAGETYIEDIWGGMKAGLSELDVTYEARIPVQAGELKGYQYAYTMKIEGVTYYASFSAWYTEELMYICTASANEANKQEVTTVLNGIYDSFTLQP